MKERPDFDDLNRKSALTIAKLVYTEIQTGISFCALAERSTSPDRRERLLGLAQQALDSANNWIWRITIHHADFDQLTASLDLLRLKIKGLKPAQSC